MVRRVVPGERGPTGGPAMTDILGILEAWEDDAVRVRRQDGSMVEFSPSLVVSGKPVRDHPSVRHRVSAPDAARRAVGSWQPVEAVDSDGWLLRASSGFTDRANSVLLVSPPTSGDWDAAVAAARAYYAERDLPLLVQTILDSEEHSELVGRGWTPAQAAPVEFLIGGVAHVQRVTKAKGVADRLDSVHLTSDLPVSWLAANEEFAAHPEAGRMVLSAGETVFASLIGGHAVRAQGRAVVHEDWVGVTDVWVDAGVRRTGLATTVLAALLGWATEQGALTAYAAVRSDNQPALAALDHLGFAAHHTYEYLKPPT